MSISGSRPLSVTRRTLMATVTELHAAGYRGTQRDDDKLPYSLKAGSRRHARDASRTPE